MSSNQNASSNQSPPSGPGASSRLSRLGPSFSVLGLALWGLTIMAYYLLKPSGLVPGEAMPPGQALRLVLTFVIAALGIFAATIVSALGLFLSASEQRERPGRLANRGVVLGSLGVAALLLVIAEIFRLVFISES